MAAQQRRPAAPIPRPPARRPPVRRYVRWGLGLLLGGWQLAQWWPYSPPEPPLLSAAYRWVFLEARFCRMPRAAFEDSVATWRRLLEVHQTKIGWLREEWATAQTQSYSGHVYVPEHQLPALLRRLKYRSLRVMRLDTVRVTPNGGQAEAYASVGVWITRQMLPDELLPWHERWRRSWNHWTEQVRTLLYVLGYFTLGLAYIPLLVLAFWVIRGVFLGLEEVLSRLVEWWIDRR